MLRWAIISLRSSRIALSDNLVAFMILRAKKRRTNTAALSANMIVHNLINEKHMCVLVPKYI